MRYKTKHSRKKTDIQIGFKNKGFHGLAIKILKKSRRPMEIQEITDKILKVKKAKGKTPDNTVSNCLQYSKHARRVSPGIYVYKR